MDIESTTLWTFHERLGVYNIILAAGFSLAAIVPVLAYVAFRSARRKIDTWRRRPHPTRPSEDVHVEALFINLILADLLEILGDIPNIRWMNDSRVTAGPLCKCQGVMKHFSGIGIATASLLIAIYSFSILVLEWKPQRYATTMIIAAGWIFTTLNVIIANGLVGHGLYGPAGYWCWITGTHRWIRIFNHYFWMWLDGILMVLFYSIIFVVLRGWLVIGNGKLHWYKNSKPSSENSREEESDEDKELKAIAKRLLFYPAVYIVALFPSSVSRWLYFTGHNPPYQFTLFANALYTLSGVFDVALFLATRPEIIRGDPASGTTNNLNSIQMAVMTHGADAMNLGNGHLTTRHTSANVDFSHSRL